MCSETQHTFDKRFTKRYKQRLQPCDCLRKQLEEVTKMVAKWPKWMQSIDHLRCEVEGK
jgi:hypothetical protein